MLGPPAAAGGFRGGGMYMQLLLMWTLWQVPAQDPPACPAGTGRGVAAGWAGIPDTPQAASAPYKS